MYEKVNNENQNNFKLAAYKILNFQYKVLSVIQSKKFQGENDFK